MKKGFITIYFIITFIGFLTVFRTPRYKSEYENRELTQFQHLIVKDFLNKNFQDNFENSFKDQFWLSERIRIVNNNVKNVFSNGKINSKICSNNYVKVTGEYYSFNCDDYLVNNVGYYSRLSDTISNSIESYNKIGEYADLYYYFINRSSNFSFINNEKTFLISDYLDDNYAELEFKNYDEYKKYYYKTDHHWNYEGSYKAYIDIIKLILGSNADLIEVKGTKTFDVKFYGSSARSSTFTKYKEYFTVYDFDIPKHKEYINRELGIYGNKDIYLDENYSKYLWQNHYGTYYGGDFGEVIFDFNQKSKYNLLILSNSFSNSVNELIATHFNKTYVVDLRHYRNTFKEDFDYKNYIKDNKIDKVLVLADINYLLSDEFNLEGGEY